MKNTTLLEKIGFAFVVIGLILLLTNSLTENESILSITKHYEIIHWLGLGTWAFGYMQREKKANSN